MERRSIKMRILLAVDGSGSSAQAGELVASLPWPHGTSITLLTAYDLPVAWFGGPGGAAGDWLTLAEDGLRRSAEGELDRLAAPLEGRGWAVDRRVVRGRAATVILAAAEELTADVVVVGSRGHGPIASMLLGSVSAEVADQARCTVLVARGFRVSRLLVTTDGSECAAIIPDVLGEWTVFKDVPAIALSVTPVDSPAFELMVSLYTLGSEPLEAQREELRDTHRRHAEAMAERLTANGIPAQPEVRSGDAAHEIIAAAGAHQADLVVTGSHCLHGLDRWLLGSVARNVLVHTSASVLIVRRREALGGS
jgi:nucleotide-binding universal stress UspA family protein